MTGPCGCLTLHTGSHLAGCATRLVPSTLQRLNSVMRAAAETARICFFNLGCLYRPEPCWLRYDRPLARPWRTRMKSEETARAKLIFIQVMLAKNYHWHN